MWQVQMARPSKDSTALHYLFGPRRAPAALSSLSQTAQRLRFTPFVRTSHPQCLWLQEVFITVEWEGGPSELATCLTHFSVGVIAFPTSLLFRFGKMPMLSLLNPGRRCFGLYSRLVFERPPLPCTSSPLGSGWPVKRGREASRQIRSQLTASCIQEPLCIQDVFRGNVVRNWPQKLVNLVWKMWRMPHF